ncbi:MAG: amino acid ABC transporter permease, partial [Sagittula sp.]
RRSSDLTFIGLFKDTTLVLIISIFDLLGILNNTLKDPEWSTPTTAYTGYLTIALIYWVFCFGMSRYSVHMERKLDRSNR